MRGKALRYFFGGSLHGTKRQAHEETFQVRMSIFLDSQGVKRAGPQECDGVSVVLMRSFVDFFHGGVLQWQSTNSL